MQLRFFTDPIVGALLTVLAVLALSVAPAFGQVEAIDEGDDVQYNGVCQNIIGSIGDINAGNTGTATSNANANADAGADDDTTVPPEGASADADAEGTSEANATADSVAEIAQETGVSIEQVNECLNGVDSGSGDKDDGNENGGDEIAGDEDADSDGASEERAVMASTIPGDKLLPVTGGFPLLAGAGLLLMAAVAVGTRVIGRR